MVVSQDIHPTIITSNDDIIKRTTFAHALRNKYVNQELLDDKLVLPKDECIDTEITFVGFGKVITVQQQLSKLTSIDLSARNIAVAGDLVDFRGSLDRVQILDLSNNSLTWSDVVSIISYLPSLRELILTGNKLNMDNLGKNSINLRSRRLTSLTLGRIYLDWDSIMKKLFQVWDCIEQLDLWDNGLDDENIRSSNYPVAEFDLFIAQVKVLRLTYNNFIDVTWLHALGNLNNLVELDLSRCKLKTITITQDIASTLSRLTVFNISYNNLENWRAVSDLHLLINLQHLLCVENPYFIKDNYSRPLTIARLRELRTLNREEITPNQRRDSEILYLRSVFPDYQQSGLSGDFIALHPRYSELIQFYGVPEDLIKKQVVDKYINLELDFKGKRLTKKLPCDMRISNVKMLCKRLFNLRPSTSIRITCHDDEPSKSIITYELDKDGQTLHFFSLKNGQILVVEEMSNKI